MRYFKTLSGVVPLIHVQELTDTMISGTNPRTNCTMILNKNLEIKKHDKTKSNESG